MKPSYTISLIVLFTLKRGRKSWHGQKGYRQSITLLFCLTFTSYFATAVSYESRMFVILCTWAKCINIFTAVTYEYAK